jgi:membrane-bound lytic murein transglycosylase B
MLRTFLIIVVGWSCCAHGATGEFSQCLAELQEQARTRGLSDRVVEQIIPGLEQQQRVLELDRQQPEFVKTFGQYFSSRVSEARVAKGRALIEQHSEFLDQLNRRFGVPGRYLVAFWGLETNYGSYLGSTPTLDSLATLACDERRSSFFSEQLLVALQMLERDSLEPDTMQGSWAGAMGHTQFMPSTYADYAVDGDGDGHVDLWGSPRDALASGANFLKQLGWQPGVRWGREVTLPKGFDYTSTGLDKPRKLSDWARSGVAQANGDALPRSSLSGAIILPAGASGPAFLVYENFHVIMGWNRSEYYALSVGHLADRVAGGGGLHHPPPADQEALSRKDVLAIQRNLAARGYDAGPADGILGPGTRQAISQFQKSVGLVPDGFPDKGTRRLLDAQ